MHVQPDLERATGIEPVFSAWKAAAWPLGYARMESVTGFEPVYSP